MLVVEAGQTRDVGDGCGGGKIQNQDSFLLQQPFSEFDECQLGQVLENPVALHTCRAEGTGQMPMGSQ